MRLVALLLLSSMALVACVVSEGSTNKPLPVCEEGTKNCPNVPKSSKKDPPPSTGGPTGTPEPGEPDPSEEDTRADAGAAKDASDASTLGPSCTKLAKCCSDLEAAGYDPATCKEIVGLKNDNACHAQHQQYKEFGDCS